MIILNIEDYNLIREVKNMSKVSVIDKIDYCTGEKLSASFRMRFKPTPQEQASGKYKINWAIWELLIFVLGIMFFPLDNPKAFLALVSSFAAVAIYLFIFL